MSVKKLSRSTSDKTLAGVCGGLGKYFGIDPVIFRIGFVISVVLGGLGLLVYILMWLLVPQDTNIAQ